MRYFLFCLLLVLTGQLFSQVTIAGQVIDGATPPAPIAFATVSLTAPDSSLLGGMLTDEEGRFTLRTDRRGTLTVTVTYLGYRPVSKSLYIGENNDVYDAGKLVTVPDVQVLDAVTVTGDRATLSGALDKKTFDLGERQAQAGGSVLDAMKALPGVTLTQDGNVQLRGSDRVAVLVDGKQSAMTGYGNQRGLGSIPAANIERIEIINNPSAKYDAAGMAGIINIIYKEEKSTGFNGEVGLSYALGELTTRREDLPTEPGAVPPQLPPPTQRRAELP